MKCLLLNSSVMTGNKKISYLSASVVVIHYEEAHACVCMHLYLYFLLIFHWNCVLPLSFPRY